MEREVKKTWIPEHPRQELVSNSMFQIAGMQTTFESDKLVLLDRILIRDRVFQRDSRERD